LPEQTAAFYFDLASPLAYLAAERIVQLLPGAQWLPVLAAELPGALETFRCAVELDSFREDVERRAGELALMPLRWPEPFPFDSTDAMLAATYAASIGRATPFAQAAFRQAFAAGRSLRDLDSILIAGAACEMHPAAIEQALGRRTIAQRLASATAQAGAAGVTELPSVGVAGRLFAGERALEQAARAAGTTIGTGT
jgi:2-hydroxychromene-2-carboxylate isomerase